MLLRKGITSLKTNKDNTNRVVTTFLYTALTPKSLKENLYGLRAVFLNGKNKHIYTKN